MIPRWRRALVARIGLSLGIAALWVWGLLLVRMLRDGLLPLEVWFGYSLSFLMTAAFVYMGLLIFAVFRQEGRAADAPAGSAPAPDRPSRLARLRRPVELAGLVGLVVALGSLVLWLALRYPGPQAVSGTIASVVLALMVLGVLVISTLIARGAR